MTPKVSIRDLSKSFGDVHALDRVSLDLHANEFVSVVGTSGCGKSTLLSIIAGLTEQDSGSVTVDGVPVTGPGRDRGVVFQGFTLLPWLTAQQNVQFALQDEPLSRAERASTAQQFLALVGLAGFENAFPRELSGGMQQRVAIARSLSYKPQILLMDEPFGALDALTRREMQTLLTRVWEQHKLTVLMITHDIEEAIITSDRVLVMSRRPGRIRADLTVPLARPRLAAMSSEPEFRQLYSSILELVHEPAA
ncbi:ABC transporter ATP-binding protein [Cryobacterium sp. TMT1-3]|uniref:ABC transporter ATP-binding protein n=1 Tax=Cryobacterium luteum TaxID=1424661 RepID=A0A1H8B0B2_9MICO|nr:MULTISPECIES: ABC transporter ATP-binding protein [Cryobacterium]TFB88690.1 ABC transporter ATP-binding protein [Cryobacterium luteum]TFC24694.1 ABC transporter ATP-binding protein [Cryobacterium sp. TMT1-3]SEM76203.1 NitT/TauT family transport system ATP-binding protein [Cryobacterium luteum]